MDIEKTLLLAAPPARVWALLLDPVAMGSCVPGMQSIEVLSDDEYVAQMLVKIAFVSARFKLKTRIVERDAPNYLRAEGTGEDTAVASSLKQTSEMWLQETAEGTTELRMKVKVDVFGRMGAFGLSVMKTKADRMWDEFGVNASARLAESPAVGVSVAGQTEASEPTPAPTPQTAGTTASPSVASAPLAASVAQAEPAAAGSQAQVGSTTAPLMPPIKPSPAHVHAAQAPGDKPGFWARLFGTGHSSNDIRIEVRRGDLVITVQWPVQAAQACATWLHTLDAQALETGASHKP